MNSKTFSIDKTASSTELIHFKTTTNGVFLKSELKQINSLLMSLNAFFIEISTFYLFEKNNCKNILNMNYCYLNLKQFYCLKKCLKDFKFFFYLFEAYYNEIYKPNPLFLQYCLYQLTLKKLKK